MRPHIAYAAASAVLGLALFAIAWRVTEAKPATPIAFPGPSYSASPDLHGFEGAQQQPSISISGEGRASAPPDVALITVNISVSAPTAAKARDKGKDAINKLLDTIKKNGVQSVDVETRSLSISPVTRRDEKSGESKVIEYRFSNVSIIKLRDVDRVGKLLDELVNRVGDALSINSISLAIENPTEIRRQAREEAMRDAQAKAQQLAALAGVGLGPPLSISEQFAGEPSGLPAKEVLVAPVVEGIAPVPVGELEAAVSVFVVYTIVSQ